MEFESADIIAKAADAPDASVGPLPAAQEAAAPPAPDCCAEIAEAAAEEPTRPMVEHLGPITWAAPANLAASGCVRLGGAFSFMCTLRMDGIDNWSRVFDFSLNADEDSITAGAVELTPDLHFTVFRGKTPFSVRVNDFFVLEQESTLLCTVSASGHMRVYKDGELVGENEDGMSPLQIERPRMIVGSHYLFHNQAFRGTIKDVKVWDQEVSWPVAAILEEAPPATAEEADEAVAEEAAPSEDGSSTRASEDQQQQELAEWPKAFDATVSARGPSGEESEQPDPEPSLSDTESAQTPRAPEEADEHGAHDCDAKADIDLGGPAVAAVEFGV